MDLQKYIRKQTNSKSNFDLLILTVDLLKVYAENLCIGNFENVLKTLDTLTEWVQGPCEENQFAVADSKFLEVANYIFDPERDNELSEINTRLDVGESRGTPIKKWQLQFLRFKCSIL